MSKHHHSTRRHRYSKREHTEREIRVREWRNVARVIVSEQDAGLLVEIVATDGTSEVLHS